MTTRVLGPVGVAVSEAAQLMLLDIRADPFQLNQAGLRGCVYLCVPVCIPVCICVYLCVSVCIPVVCRPVCISSKYSSPRSDLASPHLRVH